MRILAKTRIFFATDVHGSEKSFLKFLNAPAFYKAQVIILGGDLTGKMIVPLVKESDGYHATFRGLNRKAANEEEAQALEKEIRFTGYYPYRSTPEEVKELETDPAKVHAIFNELMIQTMKQWMQMAEERLRKTGTIVYITGGNDDFLEIEPILSGSDYVVNPEGKVVQVTDKYEMISSGWSNPTPWKTPRECSEEELGAKIERMASQVKNMRNCIFNFHVPPINSRLDECPKLDENLKPMYNGSEAIMTNVGSTSVRNAIEKYQPLLGLHGHIHESRGFYEIRRTLCLNPGSESAEGILLGAMVDIEDDKVKSYVLTQG